MRALTRTLGAFGLAGFALLGSGAADAADSVATDNVRASLISAVDAVVPGESFWVALRLDIREGWHTYWLNPGDSGEPTAIDWTLPEGFQASDIVWPTPHHVAMGPLVNYGYQGEVLHLVEITVPESAAGLRAAALRADAYWLVCEEICIPEEAQLDLSLPVAGAGTTPPPSEHAAAIAEALDELPGTSPWQATYRLSQDALTLQLDGPPIEDDSNAKFWFMPAAYGVIDHAAPQAIRAEDGGATITIPRSAYAAEAVTGPLDGVLVMEEHLPEGPLERAFHVSAAPMTAAPAAGSSPSISLAQALGLALLGGIVLNLMPCVLPILFMKGLGLVRHAHAPAAAIRLQGLSFTGGVLVSFGILAGGLIALQAGGARIGWGFQLQSPVFVALLAYLMFAIGLVLSGVVSVGGRLAGVGSDLAARPGQAGAFFTGALATVVATPCTAPFMAAALGFALTQPWYGALLVFEALGLGLALPYLALSFSPALLRFLPKPGPWMERLKQFLAFPMYATAAWLVWVLSRQIGADAVIVAATGMILIALAAWLAGTTRGTRRPCRFAGAAVSLVLLLAAIGLPVAGVSGAGGRPAVKASGPWEPYSPERFDALRAEGRAVFVNMTADWCITCKVNERVALSSDAVADAFARHDVAYLKGDWTNRDAAITAVLETFGRQGVPLYVLYPRDAAKAPVVLPQLLTEGVVIDALRQSQDSQS